MIWLKDRGFGSVRKVLRRMPGALRMQRSPVPGRRRQRIPSRVTVGQWSDAGDPSILAPVLVR